MTQTIFQVYENKSGKLWFRTDLTRRLSEEERRSLVNQLKLAIRNGQHGNPYNAVQSCIRQLALGAALCLGDPEAVCRRFRDEVAGIAQAG